MEGEPMLATPFRRGLVSGMLRQAMATGNVPALQSYVRELEGDPHPEAVYNAVRATSSRVIPTLQTLLDPLYKPSSE
jgi:hypothetical protein